MGYQNPGGPDVGQQLSRFFVRFALIEGTVFAAVILAMVLDIITIDVMLPVLIVTALIGAVVLVWKIRSVQAAQQRQGLRPTVPGQAPHPSTGESGDVSYSDRSGINSVGDPDPMSKYRDPNS
ncbi:hypothetical protein [Ruania alba]|uniref:Uncharacterized protein n=1 Tax=Ruania alba TaxID=648782 RepID=A0A1H5K8T7_9MICO|nr:hypothetical protein [Ruania alba]SEE61139.1 hypothetical protein SAMN04488554_2142 [Ruania alba]